jgi:peptide/nickel transport system substrate-binding protein
VRLSLRRASSTQLPPTSGLLGLPELGCNGSEGGVGSWNFGGSKNVKLDEYATASSKEGDPKKREQLIRSALKEHNAEVNNLPLHRQVIPWGARSNVTLVHRADNWLEWNWISVK